MKTNHSYLLGAYQSELNNVKIKIDVAMAAYKSGASLENLLNSIEEIQAMPFLKEKMNVEVEPFEFKLPTYDYKRSSFKEDVELETKTIDGHFTVAIVGDVCGYLDYDSAGDAYIKYPYLHLNEISVFDHDGDEVYNYDIDVLRTELQDKLNIMV